MNKRIKKKIENRFGFKLYKNYRQFVDNKVIPMVYDLLHKQIEQVMVEYYGVDLLNKVSQKEN